MKPIFQEIMTWQGKDFEVKIYDNKDYSNLKNIKQVYGFIFNEKGQILVVKCGKDKDWSLPGGGPEKEDKNWKDTLIREVMEEADVELKEIKPSFYLTSKSLNPEYTNSRLGISLRAVAKVSKINKQTIDPATNELPQRKFIDPKDFEKYCKWNKNGQV